MRPVNKLSYLIMTQPNIGYTVSVVSHFSSALWTIHWNVIWVLRYLKCAPNIGLLYSYCDPHVCVAGRITNWLKVHYQLLLEKKSCVMFMEGQETSWDF